MPTCSIDDIKSSKLLILVFLKLANSFGFSPFVIKRSFVQAKNAIVITLKIEIVNKIIFFILVKICPYFLKEFSGCLRWLKFNSLQNSFKFHLVYFLKHLSSKPFAFVVFQSC